MPTDPQPSHSAWQPCERCGTRTNISEAITRRLGVPPICPACLKCPACGEVEKYDGEWCRGCGHVEGPTILIGLGDDAS